ncbi:hypothetical protein Hamer_G025052 [Homarus americanus]|uniref:Uncharacterized protein n=1 Tax=Homarus americanus TaxID=6706 RepID=A0A8J5K049_HOMAM|nr:hypothetical protein Hamer_G025052 [Homarus americanus]
MVRFGTSPSTGNGSSITSWNFFSHVLELLFSATGTSSLSSWNFFSQLLGLLLSAPGTSSLSYWDFFSQLLELLLSATGTFSLSSWNFSQLLEPFLTSWNIFSQPTGPLAWNTLELLIPSLESLEHPGAAHPVTGVPGTPWSCSSRHWSPWNTLELLIPSLESLEHPGAAHPVTGVPGTPWSCSSRHWSPWNTLELLIPSLESLEHPGAAHPVTGVPGTPWSCLSRSPLDPGAEFESERHANGSLTYLYKHTRSLTHTPTRSQHLPFRLFAVVVILLGEEIGAPVDHIEEGEDEGEGDAGDNVDPLTTCRELREPRPAAVLTRRLEVYLAVKDEGEQEDHSYRHKKGDKNIKTRLMSLPTAGVPVPFSPTLDAAPPTHHGEGVAVLRLFLHGNLQSSSVFLLHLFAVFIRPRGVVDERELQQRPEDEGETHTGPHVDGLQGGGRRDKGQVLLQKSRAGGGGGGGGAGGAELGLAGRVGVGRTVDGKHCGVRREVKKTTVQPSLKKAAQRY